MFKDVIDRIYEAAFVPELWPEVLDSIGAISSAPGGTLFVFEDIQPIRFQSTELVREVTETFCTGEAWKENQRIQYFHQKPFTGFVIAQDYYPPGFLDRDAPFRDRNALGLESQIGAMIPMPSGELAAFVFEKWERDGAFSVADVQYLDSLYPHLARAGLIAARLGLERAQATTSALQAMGLPAAVMTKSGRVLSANSLLESLTKTFLPVAYGGLAIANSESNRLFQHAVEAARSNYEPGVRSIPVPAQDGTGPMIVHVMPLHRAAHDIFAGADILVAATSIRSSNLVPSPTVLTGLFDLSPAEARLAVVLASGHSLKSAAAMSSVTFKTARTYLERVFAKTGTHQQSELVALLKSAQPFPTNCQ